MHKSRMLHTMALATAIAIVTGIRTTSAGIVVSPLKQDVSVKPGRTAKFYITISNNARNKWDKTQSVHLELMDFAVGEGGGVFFEPVGTVRNSASRWIKIVKPDLQLAPGEGERVECTITAQFSAAGEYYSAVMVTIGMLGRTDRGVSVGFRTASGVFVTIEGRTFPKQAKIVRSEVIWPKAPAKQPTATEPADDPAIDPAIDPADDPAIEPTDDPAIEPTDDPAIEPVKVIAVLKNTGRVRFEASGELRISDGQGSIVYRTPMTSKRARILPGDVRLFEAVLDKALPPGEYRVKVELDYQSKWAKARTRLPLTISSDQAALLAKVAAQANPAGTDKESEAMIQVAPERLTAKIPPGAFRSLSVSVQNAGQDTVQCTAAVASEGDMPIPASWMRLQPVSFTLGKDRSKVLSLVVHVPSDAAGLYKGTLVVEAIGAGGTESRTKFPIDLMITTGN